MNKYQWGIACNLTMCSIIIAMHSYNAGRKYEREIIKDKIEKTDK